MTQRQQCIEDLRNNLKDLNMLFARAQLYKYDRMAMTTIEDYIIEKLTQSCVNADKLRFLFPDECKEGQEECKDNKDMNIYEAIVSLIVEYEKILLSLEKEKKELIYSGNKAMFYDSTHDYKRKINMLLEVLINEKTSIHIN